MNKKQLERWSPLILMTAIVVIWQAICSIFNVSEFIFPSPARIWEQTLEYKGVIAQHAWRTFWVTMAGFGIAIVVGVLLGFLIGSSRLAYAAVYPLMTAFNALPKAAFVPILVVWFGIGIGPAILTRGHRMIPISASWSLSVPYAIHHRCGLTAVRPPPLEVPVHDDGHVGVQMRFRAGKPG